LGSSSDNEDDLISLFANLNVYQKKKLNELIETTNEKDDLLGCQDDLLVKENKKIVKLKNPYALEVEKCGNLSKKLSICNNSISCLRVMNWMFTNHLHLLLSMLSFALNVEMLIMMLLMITLL
jgi:hypothetical protein